MVNLYDAMKIKQDRSGLLTKEYFQWYSEASDIFRNYKDTCYGTLWPPRG